MLKTRLLVALIGMPLSITIIYFGGFILMGALLILASIAYFYEYRNMIKVANSDLVWISGAIAFALFFFAHYCPLDINLFLTVILLITIIQVVIEYPTNIYQDVVYTFFGAFYIAYLFGFGVSLGFEEHHFVYMILVLFLAWGNDSGGYIFGSLFGRHKLTPLLSPKKTVEGAIGGIALATAAIAGLNFVLGGVFSWGPLLVLCLLGSIASQCGDLFASLIKRFFGVKDAGHILPGHGGILDRFDSFIVILPIVYYFVDTFGY